MLVLSRKTYNLRSGLCLACPVTNTVRGYPFDVNLPMGFPVSGTVRADQVRSLAWAERRCEFIIRCPPDIFDDVREKLATVLEL